MQLFAKRGLCSGVRNLANKRKDAEFAGALKGLRKEGPRFLFKPGPACRLTTRCWGVVTTLFLVMCVGCASKDNFSPAATDERAAASPAVEVAKVIREKASVKVRLPGELEPYEVVQVYPKVTGYVKWIGVDRGSHVKAGEMIARLEAPEIVSRSAEAQARLESAQSQLVVAQARFASDESTYEHLKAAAATPGVVAGNDLVVSGKTVEAGRAQVKAQQDNVAAAKQAFQSVSEIAGYLQVKAPFDGVVTERNVHPGALVGPAGTPGVAVPMLRIETLARLRLVVPVPETYIAGIPEGTKVGFGVPAFPGESFNGTVARISHNVDQKTRTMPVELDVLNPSGRLTPGSFSEVEWPVRRPEPTLFVPSSSIATTLERTFVVRVKNGEADWVDVKAGLTSGNLTEVFGNLNAGDEVATRGTDELQPGMRVTPKRAP